MKHLVLRITERCNLYCRYCYADASAQSDMPDMTPGLACRAIEIASEAGGHLKVQFTGGEPLLNFDVVQAVYEFGRRTGRSLQLAVQTNGTLLDAEMCKKLRDMRCGIGVSLDGIGEGNVMRTDGGGKNAFDRIAKGIWQLGEAGMSCNLTSVISSANAGRLDEMLDVAIGFGNVKAIGFDMLRKLGRGTSSECEPQEETLKAGLSKLLARYEEMESMGVAPRLREIRRANSRRSKDPCAPYCYAQTGESMAVDGLGDTYPCSSLAGIEGYRLGSLDGVYAEHEEHEGCGVPCGMDGSGDKEARVRDSLRAPAGCLACRRFAACRGGCPAASSGDGCKSPLDCLMHRTFVDYVEGRVSMARFA